MMMIRSAPSSNLLACLFCSLSSNRNRHRHFAAVLNFLRDGQLNYPPDGTDFKYLLELRAEAEYYGLCGMVAQIDRCLSICTRSPLVVAPTASMTVPLLDCAPPLCLLFSIGPHSSFDSDRLSSLLLGTRST